MLFVHKQPLTPVFCDSCVFSHMSSDFFHAVKMKHIQVIAGCLGFWNLNQLVALAQIFSGQLHDIEVIYVL